MRTSKRAIRLALRDVFDARGLDAPDDEAFLWECVESVWRAMQDRGEQVIERAKVQDRQRILKAMAKGAARNTDLMSLWRSNFHTSPNWDTKTNKGFLEWLKGRPENETLDAFADWWWRYDWRGKESQPPTPAQVREMWPQAFDGETVGQNLLFDV